MGRMAELEEKLAKMEQSEDKQLGEAFIKAIRNEEVKSRILSDMISMIAKENTDFAKIMRERTGRQLKVITKNLSENGTF